MAPTSNMNMVIDSINDIFKNNCENYDEVKDHSLAFSIHCPRSPFISLSKCDEEYLARVQHKSNNIVKNDHTPSDSLQYYNLSLELRLHLNKRLEKK